MAGPRRLARFQKRAPIVPVFYSAAAARSNHTAIWRSDFNPARERGLLNRGRDDAIYCFSRRKGRFVAAKQLENEISNLVQRGRSVEPDVRPAWVFPQRPSSRTRDESLRDGMELDVGFFRLHDESSLNGRAGARPSFESQEPSWSRSNAWFG